MSEVETEQATSNGAITVTVKAGSGYNAPWLVVRGDTAAEVEATINQIDMSGLLPAVARLGTAFGKLWVETGGEKPTPPTAQQAQNVPQQVSGPQRGDVHPTESCPDCNGQVRFVKAGQSSRGKWQLWSCGNRDHKGVFTNPK